MPLILSSLLACHKAAPDAFVTAAELRHQGPVFDAVCELVEGQVHLVMTAHEPLVTMNRCVFPDWIEGGAMVVKVGASAPRTNECCFESTPPLRLEPGEVHEVWFPTWFEPTSFHCHFHFFGHEEVWVSDEPRHFWDVYEGR